jgi:hypothetical protein
VADPEKKSTLSEVRIPGTRIQGGRAIAVGALGLYTLLFILLNNRRLEVNFVFFKFRSHELLALIVILACGFAAGYFVHGRRHPAAPGQTPPDEPEPAPPDQADR